ncbi:MAG TPA: Rne/Rng family ribonuclease, partial [Desulfuromonadales bacterium]|nr:Rne/Rng family ribonuclease [Desulfuromonadales bacterium]
ERLGFLQMGEIHPSYFRAAEENGENKGRPRINDVLHRGQEMLFQVVKEERGTKGAALTTYLSLPGRYMVLMPESDSKGISRKIEEEVQRKALKEAMGSLDLPPDMGYIVRTAGIGQSREELKRDFDYLVRVYENILALSKQAKVPALIYKESNLVIRSIRDYFTADTDEVLIDDPKVFQEARDFFQQVMPEYAKLVKLHQERRPIFARYQIEEQIETIYRNKVALSSGGSIVIDATEALVAIDVNSGKMATEQGVEATAYKTNLEAAAEAGRQLRLRDLGGLIVIDFIDMRDRKHIRDVEKTLKDALKYDKARVTVGRISQFGLLEMSRQRIKATLAEGAYLPCPHCEGLGRIKSPESQAIAFLRKVQASIAKGQIGRIEGEVPLDVANYLLNVKRDELQDMERQYQLEIFVQGRPDFIAGQFELTLSKRQKEEPSSEPLEAVTAGLTAMELAAAEPPAAAVESGEGVEEPKKKRKRRRRKKKTDATDVETGLVPEAENTGTAVPAGSESSVETSEEGNDSPVAPPMETAGTNESEDGEEVKKKRRRRRRKKPASAEPAVASAESVASAEAAAPTETAAATTASTEPAAPTEPAAARSEAETTAKPSRTRRRTTKPKTATEPAEAAAASAESTAPPEPVASAEPAAKPSRPRRRTTKPKTATDPAEAVAASAEPTAPTEPVASAEPAAARNEAEPAAKPPQTRRRTTKPKTETVIAPANEEPATAEVDDKPARPRKRPTNAKSASQPGTATVEAEAVGETAASAPKQRTSRARAKAAAGDADASPKTARSRKNTADSEKAASETEAQPKKRTTRKKASPSVTQDAETGEG